MTDSMEYCVIHPDKKAHWICPQCEQGYCPACISKRSSGLRQKEAKYFCPKCNVQADWVGAGNLIPPFWKRLHNFFTYPIARDSLIMIFSCAAVTALGGALGLFGLLLQFVAWGVGLKYAFEVLRSTSRGRLIPPKIDMGVLSDNFSQVFQQGIILILFVFLGGYIASVTGSYPVVLLYIAVVAFFWPSIVILQVISGSITRAINPLYFVPLVGRIGLAYVLMYFFLVLVVFAPASIFSFIQPEKLPLVVFIFLKTAVEVYYMLLMYHLMGYVLLQYHLEIGYTVYYEDFADIEDNSETEEALSSDAVRTDLLLQDGKIDEALSFLRGKANTGALTDVNLSEKYYKLLKAKDDTQEMSLFATQYMRQLLAADRGRECVRVYEECLAHDAKYLPTGGVVPGLGEALEQDGKIRHALALYSNFLRTFPRDAQAGEVFLRAGILLNERMGERDKARSLLQAGLARIPESPVRERIANYLKNSL